MRVSNRNHSVRIAFLSVPLLILSLLALGQATEACASTQTLGTLLLPAGVIAMTTPDPPNVTVTPCDALNGIILAPDQTEPLTASVAEIVVRNSDNVPIANAVINVLVGASNVVCPGATLSGTTDGEGRCTIVMAGGGCSDDVELSGVIKANGVTIRAYANAKSPDANGDLRVDLADLILFSDEFLGTSNDGCHDYDDNAETSLSDLIIFGEAFLGANHCP